MKRRDVIKRISKEAKTQGVSFDQKREGANHTVYNVGGCMIPIARHNEIDDQMAREIFKEARTRKGLVAMSNTYHAQVRRGDRYWLIYVPEVDRSTQAR